MPVCLALFVRTSKDEGTSCQLFSKDDVLQRVPAAEYFFRTNFSKQVKLHHHHLLLLRIRLPRPSPHRLSHKKERDCARISAIRHATCAVIVADTRAPCMRSTRGCARISLVHSTLLAHAFAAAMVADAGAPADLAPALHWLFWLLCSHISHSFQFLSS